MPRDNPIGKFRAIYMFSPISDTKSPGMWWNLYEPPEKDDYLNEFLLSNIASCQDIVDVEIEMFEDK